MFEKNNFQTVDLVKDAYLPTHTGSHPQCGSTNSVSWWYGWPGGGGRCATGEVNCVRFWWPWALEVCD